MTGSHIRAKWDHGESALGGWCMTGSPYVAEAIARAGYDYVCLDMQHGLIGYESVVQALYALTGTGTSPVVRVPSHDSGMIGRVLDAGAEAVVVPLVETAEQAAAVAKACRYFPEGHRSVGSIRGGYNLQGPVATVNRQVSCIVMIETMRGVENVDAICSTPGIDGVYVGPGDLALTLGLPPGLAHQPGAHADAIAHVRDRCIAHGLVAGLQCHTGVDARIMLDQGYRMVTVTTDSTVVQTGFAAQLAATRD
ncbi:4-hydroxy-2-oxoheptanedioate aldolase [Rhodococcus sp. 27YEA15]|uniref:HpcH/HpaI aldolase family protein n=1 Tax=Rhodococcus sp. 27YEA15 TaxID=3156259 RepID=UPI003C7B7F33